MDRLVFSSHSAITEQANARRMLVNELSNVSTTGFKRSYELAMGSVKADGPGFDTRYNAQSISVDAIDLNPGAIIFTGQATDVAFQDQTVMGVQAENGELAFSRRGDLRVNPSGLLVDGTGKPVFGQGGLINVPLGSILQINRDGTVFARDPEDPVAESVFVDQLLLRDASETVLTRRQDGLFTPFGLPSGSDFPSGPKTVGLSPGALESSNVNPIVAMTKLIDHSRTFEAQIRVIKEAKSLDESGSSMMRNS